MKTLYHYTSLDHLPDIIESGRLLPSDNCLHVDKVIQPNVVWLTTDSQCKYPHGLQLTSLAPVIAGKIMSDEWVEKSEKTRVRFTVVIPNDHVYRWREWAKAHNSDPVAMKRLIKLAGGGANTWRVVQHPIMSDRWAQVLDMKTGEDLWTPTRQPARVRCEECRQYVRRDAINHGHALACPAGPRMNMEDVRTPL